MNTYPSNSSGVLSSEKRYMTWGEERWANGDLPTTFSYTGQREQAELGLYFYQSRWYDPYLNRWIQPDSIIPDPGNSIDLDRYAYARNNPVRYIDPSGHLSEDQIIKYLGVSSWEEVLALFGKGGQLEGRWGWLETLRQAELGDEVGWLGEYDWFWETRFDTELYRGKLTELDGQLFLESASGLLSIFDAAMQGNNIFVEPTMGRAVILNASYKYQRLQFKEWHDIDKVDFWVDVFGIVGDIASSVPGPGTAVWFVSEIPELLTLGKSWDQLDTGDSSGVAIAQSSRLVPEGG